MNQEIAEQIRGKGCYVASAGSQGLPHLAAASVDEVGDRSITVSAWFCPQTLANLEANPRVSVVVMLGEDGVQLAGEVEERAVEAVLDGYGPEDADFPRAKFRLQVRVDRTTRLADRPHSDREIGG